MRISKIRNYISQQVKSVDPQFEQWNDAFNTENLPATKYGKSYHVTYSIGSASRNQTTEILNVRATVTFFFKGYKDINKGFDEAMDLVNIIALNCMSQSAIYAFRSTDNFPIQTVERSSQIPQPQNTNDNSILIPLELELEIIQSIC